MENSKLFLISVLIISHLYSCKGVSISHIDRTNINGTEYAILKFNPDVKYPIFKNSIPTILTKDEIIEIEKIAGDKISEIITNHNLRKKTANIYVRQYVGAINANGEKEVWINIFCKDLTDTEWKKGIINVADGGDCAFNLKVNINKKTLYDLIINLSS